MPGSPVSSSASSQDALEKYLEEISQIPLISPQEEIELTRRFKEGYHDALNTLVQANLRFVVKVAKEYQNMGLPLIDLIDEGNIGLMKAADRFDETRGFRFISYAVWWIRQSILQALAENARVVRLPLNRVGLINKINHVVRELAQQYNREPTSEEISELLDISGTDVAEALNQVSHHVSLDQPITRGEDKNYKDFMENPDSERPDNALLKESLKNEINRVLKTLTSREADVIRMYFGIDIPRPLTLEEMAAKLKLTRERIRQIKEKALTRLRHQSRSQNLRLFL
jgi:RNA polymerase primary sigma factor